MSKELSDFAKKYGIETYEPIDLSEIDEDILAIFDKFKLDINDDEIEDLDVIAEREEKRQQKERELLAQEIIKQQTKEDKRLYNKEDIMMIFSCESDKALKILRLSHQMGYALKMGKEYYIAKEDLNTFLEQIKGRNTIL
jgi:hypothetical protein